MQPIIPCEQDSKLAERIEEVADTIKAEAHKLGTHGIPEEDFYRLGVFRGAIERIRGQFSAEMGEKRDFASRVLAHMQDNKFIKDWTSSGSDNRHDYTVIMPNDRVAVIELKGCLDGNNTTIFERPAHAQEFLIWSVCSNAGADPRHNVWSGVHVRLGAEMITTGKHVDGLIVWDWLCGTFARPCPKLKAYPGRETAVGPWKLPPPCIYLFPRTVPEVRNNPNPEPHRLEDVSFLAALNQCFNGYLPEVNRVRYKVAYKGKNIIRTTSIERGGIVQHESKPRAIRRT
jgi:hypothetical protein